MPRIRLPNRQYQQRRPKSRTASCCFRVQARLADPLVLLMFGMAATAFVGIVLLGRGNRLAFQTTDVDNYSNNTSSVTQESSLETTTAVATKMNVVVVAYAVTITHCTSELHSQQLLDSAAVVKHSIQLATTRQSLQPQSTGKNYYDYEYQMYAFLHVDARSECAIVASTLEHQLGYIVQWHTTPFRLDDVARKNPLLGEKIHTQGCCEEKELLKLYTLELTNHKIAVHLDLDTILLQPLNHLFNAMLILPNSNSKNYNKDRQLVQQHMQQHHDNRSKHNEEGRLPDNITCFFTRDYNMANPGIKPPRVGMQGGFWVVRPDPQVMKDMVSLIVDHADHYNKECGWGSCKLGSARFYGGAGFQGILSYFYTYVQPQRMIMTAGPEPQEPQFVELDRCLYNTMVDPPRSGCRTGKDTVACQSCQETDFAHLYGAHFTLCQKPYNCPPLADSSPLCYRLHHAWHAIRADLEERQQQQHQQQATEMKNASSASAQHLFSLPSLLELGDPTLTLKELANPRFTNRLVQKFSKHCPKVGKKAYRFITFE